MDQGKPYTLQLGLFLLRVLRASVVEFKYMRILFIAPQPFFTIRGTPLAVRELVTTIASLGHKVDLLTYHIGEDISINGLTIYRNKIFSRLIREVPPGYSATKALLDLVLFPKALWLILKNSYDAVHCVEESSYFISWFKWIKSFLFVFDMDSDIPRQLEDSGKIPGALVKIAGIFDRFALSKADAVVTICPMFTQKINSIYPGKPVFQIEDVSVREEITPAPTQGERIILYTGNFEAYQGVELLLAAVSRLRQRWPSIKLLLVGGEPKEIGKLKSKYPEKNILFAGKKSYCEMPSFLAIAEILVSPRRCGENTPFKIYSYLASGKPVLATNIISHSQILHSGTDSLLVEPTEDGIAGGLEKLLVDAALAQKIGAGGRKLFEANYSRKRYAEKVGNLLCFMEAWTRNQR